VSSYAVGVWGETSEILLRRRVLLFRTIATQKVQTLFSEIAQKVIAEIKSHITFSGRWDALELDLECHSMIMEVGIRQL
jgi:hypothetical protein